MDNPTPTQLLVQATLSSIKLTSQAGTFKKNQNSQLLGTATLGLFKTNL